MRQPASLSPSELSVLLCSPTSHVQWVGSPASLSSCLFFLRTGKSRDVISSYNVARPGARRSSAQDQPAVHGVRCREHFTTRIQVAVRTRLLKPGTVKQGRARHGRSNRRVQEWLPWLTGKSENGGLGDRVRGQPGMSCCCCIAVLVASLMGTLWVQETLPVGEEEERKGEGMRPGSFVSRLSPLSCRQES